MTSPEENVHALSRAVLSEARADAEQIMSEARAKAQAAREHAQEEAESARQEILDRARREAEHVRSNCLAGARLQAQNLRLERREAVLERVFDAVRDRMPTIQQWTDYDQIAIAWVQEAATQLGGDELRIRADAHTRDILAAGALDQLSQELGITLHLTEALPDGLGVVAETMDGHLKYDNTLAARLQRQQDQLRSPVYKLLMGETQ
jgi:vacuolar-type H+-ATPase subunit E/Vma4